MDDDKFDPSPILMKQTSYRYVFGREQVHHALIEELKRQGLPVDGFYVDGLKIEGNDVVLESIDDFEGWKP